MAARRITDDMIAAAADAVARLSDATTPGASLLPPVTNLRMVSAAVAIAVARAADKGGPAQVPLADPVHQVHQAMWQPMYPAFAPHLGVRLRILRRSDRRGTPLYPRRPATADRPVRALGVHQGSRA